MSQLGIDLQQIVLQTVNFLVLLFVLKRFLYQPLLKLLEERRQEAEQTEKTREELGKKMEQVEKKQQEILAKGRQQAEKILEKARDKGDKLAVKIETEARKQAEQMLQKTQQELDQRSRQLKKELRQEVSRVVLQAADKVLQDELTESQKGKLTERAVGRFVQDE